MRFLQESEHERLIRRLKSCTHTLYDVAEDLTDPEGVEERADLVIAAENLAEIASYVVEACRGIAWQYSPVPGGEDDEEED